MNKQQIFETVAKHLFTQGKQAINVVTDHCMYRTPEGTMCAVGCLIPDDIYTENMEFMGVHSLLEEFDNILPKEIKRNVSLLSDLQSIHDGNEFWISTDTMKKELRYIGTQHHLSTKFLNDLKFSNR